MNGGNENNFAADKFAGAAGIKQLD